MNSTPTLRSQKSSLTYKEIEKGIHCPKPSACPNEHNRINETSTMETVSQRVPDPKEIRSHFQISTTMREDKARPQKNSRQACSKTSEAGLGLMKASPPLGQLPKLLFLLLFLLCQLLLQTLQLGLSLISHLWFLLVELLMDFALQGPDSFMVVWGSTYTVEGHGTAQQSTW